MISENSESNATLCLSSYALSIQVYTFIINTMSNTVSDPSDPLDANATLLFPLRLALSCRNIPFATESCGVLTISIGNMAAYKNKVEMLIVRNKHL